MKTLDDQVPSGYFDALPNRTLARLEGKDMQQSTTGTTNEHEPVLPPSAPPAVKEDSGLHDIRSLAQSTKQRMASKRVTTSPVKTDDELLAASSAGWVAMPEPAKMVSLPSMDELPSKKEVRAEMKASKAAAVSAADASASASIERPAFGANLTARKKGSKAPVVIAGVVLAAAAGVGIYVFTQNQDNTSAQTVAKAETTQGAAANTAPVAAPTPPVKAAEPSPPPPPAQPDATDSAAAAGSAAVAETPPPVEIAKTDPVPAKGMKHSGTPTKSKPTGKMSKTAPPEDTTPTKVETKAPPPEDTKPKDVKKGGKGDENEPSFDALLKEAGVDQTKKPTAPKLEKKQLAREDFSAGMQAIKSKAEACYKSTQGTAQFKMVVAPSGQVTSVSVTGPFAGKPEGACVEAAVRSAHFSAWDGAPQTFTYSYLLHD